MSAVNVELELQLGWFGASSAKSLFFSSLGLDLLMEGDQGWRKLGPKNTRINNHSGESKFCL